MAEYHGLYRRAYYYDIVFRRDVTREIDFVVALCNRDSGRSPRSVLELACGPGYHARAFAKRGLRAVGLDLEEEMIRFARDRANEDGVDVEWLAADMREFRLREPVDVAVSMFDGIDALTTNDDLIRHLRSVADNLTDGGLYIVDVTHPQRCGFQNYGQYRYSGARNGVRVELRWPAEPPELDLVEGVAEVRVEMRIEENGDGRVVQDSARERFLTPQEIRLLARCSGALEPIGWYGDFELDRPLQAESESGISERMITVFQKN